MRLLPVASGATVLRHGRVSRPRWMALLVAASVTLCLAACSPGSADTAESLAVTSDVPTFQGPPSEYITLMAECVANHGVTSGTVPPDAAEQGYYYVADASEREAHRAARLACEAEIGVPQELGLSAEQLSERYNARLEQHECLVEQGLVPASVEPPTFESFVEEYRRSATGELWDPRTAMTGSAPLGVCVMDSW